MARFLPSPQQLLIFVVEKGTTTLPLVILLALLACAWTWRRPRPAVRYGAGGLLLVFTLVSTAALLLSYTVRREIRQHTLGLQLQTLDPSAFHRVSDWRGQVLVVNFWATWCLPCRQELPHLARLARAYRDQGVVVVTLTSEEPSVVRRWSEPSLEQTVRATFTDDTPPSGLASVVLQWRPVTLILDRQAEVRRIMLGPQTFVTLERAVREAS